MSVVRKSSDFIMPLWIFNPAKIVLALLNVHVIIKDIIKR